MPLDAPSPRGFVALEIAACRRETDDAISVAFAVPASLAEQFRFIPGQYLTLRTLIDGEDLRRSYSICSGPDEPLRIAIKRVEDGRFSAWAHGALAPGHVLGVMPPQGRFTLPPAATPAPRHVLAVAAGSGITPILAILKATLAAERQTAFTLLYGSRSTAGILFRDELEALKDRFLARLTIQHVLSREQQDIPVLNGRLDAVKIDALLRGGTPDRALLCGPATLIDAATATLGARMPQADILSERFSLDGRPARQAPKPAVKSVAFAAATVIADGVATEIPMHEGEAVLDAALRAGLDLPYSCRAGMCSTCRARVTAGEVTMAVNYGLEPWETAAGFVLTCQARPTTPCVTIDYDHM